MPQVFQVLSLKGIPCGASLGTADIGQPVTDRSLILVAARGLTSYFNNQRVVGDASLNTSNGLKFNLAYFLNIETLSVLFQGAKLFASSLLYNLMHFRFA